METKDILRALLWSALIFFAWQMIAVRIWPPVPVDKNGAPADQAPTPAEHAERPSGNGGPSQLGANTQTGGNGGFRVESGEPRQIVIGSVDRGKDDPYRMSAEVMTEGAAIAAVSLSDYRLSPGKGSSPYQMLTPQVNAKGDPVRSFATERIHVREWSADVNLRDVDWNVEEQSEGRATLGATILRGEEPALRIHKTFAVPSHAGDHQRHDLTIDYAVDNLTDQPLSVILTQAGPVGLHQEDLRFDDRMLFRGTTKDGIVGVKNFAMQSDKEVILYRDGAEDPILWAAVANKYFVAFMTPRAQPGHSAVEWVEAIKQVPVPATSGETPTATLSLSTKPLMVAAGASTRVGFDTYLGPKLRSAFQSVEDYSRLGYEQQILSSYSQGACAFITPTALTRFMVWMLNSLSAMVRNYGVAIIILVLIVRTILHPLTKKGQVNMVKMQQRMGTLAPRMEEIKKRYPNDKTKQSQEMMKVYQEMGVNPATGMMSSMLPMFLQMPIWISLFTSLNYNIEMRHQPFCLWIRDLTAPDALIRFASEVHIPIISSMTGPINSFNLLPIFVSVAMFAQQKLMPKPKPPPGQSTEQTEQAAQMQKMMPYMTLFFGLFFYNMPSGLNLYIGTSSFFGMIEQWRIRKHIEELKNKPPANPPKVNQPKRGSFFERLQKMAEESQKLKTARSNGNKRVKKTV